MKILHITILSLCLSLGGQAQKQGDGQIPRKHFKALDKLFPTIIEVDTFVVSNDASLNKARARKIPKKLAPLLYYYKDVSENREEYFNEFTPFYGYTLGKFNINENYTAYLVSVASDVYYSPCIALYIYSHHKNLFTNMYELAFAWNTHAPGEITSWIFDYNGDGIKDILTREFSHTLDWNEKEDAHMRILADRFEVLQFNEYWGIPKKIKLESSEKLKQLFPLTFKY